LARVVIAGVSARAAAESAAHAGFSVTAIDAFGDLDQDPSVRSIALGHRFSARAAAGAAAAGVFVWVM
jgi:predicted ATP-grasp superfamily ATP-dependent carboligase